MTEATTERNIFPLPNMPAMHSLLSPQGLSRYVIHPVPSELVEIFIKLAVLYRTAHGWYRPSSTVEGLTRPYRTVEGRYRPYRTGWYRPSSTAEGLICPYRTVEDRYRSYRKADCAGLARIVISQLIAGHTKRTEATQQTLEQ